MVEAPATDSVPFAPPGWEKPYPGSPILKDRLQMDLTEEAMLRERALIPKPTLLESARDWLWGKPREVEQDSGVETPSK